MHPNLSRSGSLVALTALALMVVSPASAQEDLPARTDLQALVYYVEHDDLAAATAEQQRLQVRFPAWSPPGSFETLKLRDPGEEIDAIFRLIAENQLSEARSLIELTLADYPFWEPPAEMMALLELAEAQVDIDSALAAGDALKAIRVAVAFPDLLRCDRVNNAWRIAETQRQKGDRASAIASYSAILRTCTEWDIIAATLQKLSAFATDPELKERFALVEDRFQDRLADIRKLRLSLTGTTEVARQDLPARAKLPPPQRGAPETDAPSQAATATTGSAQNDPRAAPASSTPGSSPRRSAQGGASPGQADPGVVAAARAGNWSACVARARAARDAPTIYEAAWCSYNLERPSEALSRFRVAHAANLGASVTRDARFGMALAYLKMYMTDEASQIAATTDLTAQQRLEVESTILDQRGVRSFRQKNFRRAIQYFDALESIASLRRDLAIMRAYAHLNIGDRQTANDQFRKLHDALATMETRRGLRASQL